MIVSVVKQVDVRDRLTVGQRGMMGKYRKQEDLETAKESMIQKEGCLLSE